MTPIELKSFIEKIVPTLDMLQELVKQSIKSEDFAWKILTEHTTKEDLQELEAGLKFIFDKLHDTYWAIEESHREVAKAIGFNSYKERIVKVVTPKTVRFLPGGKRETDLTSVIDNMDDEAAEALLKVLQKKTGLGQTP